MSKNGVWEKDPLAGRNERIKLLATTSNNIGLAILGLAALRPLIDSVNQTPWFNMVTWTVIGLAMHVLSHYILNNLKREKKQ